MFSWQSQKSAVSGRSLPRLSGPLPPYPRGRVPARNPVQAQCPCRGCTHAGGSKVGSNSGHITSQPGPVVAYSICAWHEKRRRPFAMRTLYYLQPTNPLLTIFTKCSSEHLLLILYVPITLSHSLLNTSVLPRNPHHIISWFRNGFPYVMYGRGMGYMTAHTSST